MKTITRTSVSPLVVPSSVPVPSDVWFRSGTMGWALIGAGVLIWDLVGPETMSDAFDRARERQVSRALVVAGWTVLTLHLFNKLPAKLDPLHMICVARDHVRHFDCCADPWPDDIV